jgi:S1-C subfamily serine protease
MTCRFGPLASLWVLSFGLHALADVPATEKDVRPSVVKIESSIRQPDLSRPWERPQSSEVSGSGLVIEGKRILTNAHVVAYAGQVNVLGQNSSEKFSAQVEAMATGIDLAVLKLEDEKFFDGKPPLPLAESLPKVRDNVLVYGYPTGGTSLSVTKGIVSRVEFFGYDSDTWGVRGQIDAAINPGNSGGPAVIDGKLLGVAFSRLGGADNIGYIIPAEEVALFLEDVKDGKYDGKPTMFDQLQTLENPALRRKLKIPSEVSGIVVHRTEPPRLDDGTPLKEWDLITKIGDETVDNTGQVKVADGLTLPFQYYVPKLTKGGKVPLTVFRDGQTLQVNVPVASTRARVMPSLRGSQPSYFIFGPIVFSAATNDFVLNSERSQGGWFAWLCGNKSPLALRVNDRPKFEDEQIVVVPSPMFTHRLVKGYSDVHMQTIYEINGVPIKNLKHLVETIRDAKDDMLVISFNEENCETIVLDRKALVAASEDILADNGIRKPCSPDLLPVWEKK